MKRLLSDIYANVDVAIEKNNYVTIIAFLLELGICTRIDNYGIFIDNDFGVDVREGRRRTFRLSFDTLF